MQRSLKSEGEEGHLMVLTIGYVVIALLLATVVAAASAIYIEHKKLLSVADGASVAAADSYTLGQVDSGAETPWAVLNSERVRSVTESYLSQNGAHSRFDQLAVARGTGSPDSATAEVVLSAVAHPPVVSFLLPDGVPIEARSTARSRLAR
ncbi:pilus assembly protein TadG-related protein [Arthrobacter sp. efr-133-TYG-118]|uniref:pilus assembly protein TadG-related protein n=1 Tax=Arthrobacter sp. efr-133-TYG-118 TaxID=3040279 RepID=UPI00254C5EDE|nr:pilus assembly protein TadG-related protein [Arthrobacter sp. efr-133-TYG-118]